MAIPFIYNVRSVGRRWTSSVVTILGIAGAVGVFVAMLSMARGFQATLVASGSETNALVRRAGATSELESAIELDSVRIIETAPGVARSSTGPLVSAEVLVIAAFPLTNSGTDANAQVRGVSPRALEVRDQVKITEGRFFTSGLTELAVGKNARRSYRGLEIGNTLKFGGAEWTVTGVFDSGGTAFDSEIWCDARVLNQVYQRPDNMFQTVAVRLESIDSLTPFKDALTADPRLTVQVDRETDYFKKQTGAVTTLIQVIGTLVAVLMGIGAVFAALNTMYSAVAERMREVATLRALGFSAGSVILSFTIEALLIAAAGGALGLLAVVPLNGYTTGTLNWQTFSHVAFAFRVTPDLLAEGFIFALIMGLIGGVPPALRAARRPVAIALREL